MKQDDIKPNYAALAKQLGCDYRTVKRYYEQDLSGKVNRPSKPSILDPYKDIVRDEAYDYSGRLMKKSAWGNPNSKFHPTLEHIRPLTKGGSDVLENIIICHRDTNEEKADKFPAWKANGGRFHAIRVRGSRVAYEIVEDED